MEEPVDLKTDGYTGSVAPPVEGVYNSMAYQSVGRVNNMLTDLKKKFFVMNWDPNYLP